MNKKQIFVNYSDYLNSQHWLKFRNKIIFERGYRCEECGWDENLNVHHDSYDNLGNEKPSDVRLLCYRCHMEFHENENADFFRNEEIKAKDYFILMSSNLSFFGIDESECMELKLTCTSCLISKEMEPIYLTGKYGCTCGNKHQRWMLNKDYLLFLPENRELIEYDRFEFSEFLNKYMFNNDAKVYVNRYLMA